MLSTRLWRHGPFVRFFIGASLSVVGDWFNTVAIALLTFRLTGQVSFVAITIAVSVLPRVVLSPIGGALADRFDRRRLLVLLDVVRAVVALLPLLAHDRGTLWLIYATVLLLQAGACVYNPAQRAYIAHLVPDELLEPANAAYATMSDIGMFAGPALAAAVLGSGGLATAFWANALSFLVAAGLVLSLPRAVHAPMGADNLRALMAGHASIVRRYPRIAALYLCYLAYVIPIYFFQAIMVIYAEALGHPPKAFVGVLYAAAGLGGAAGGLFMGQYLRRLPYSIAMAIFALSVPLLGLLALLHNTPLALIVLACSTAAGTSGDVVFTVNVQRYVAPEERGRAFGMVFWCIAVGQLIGAILGTIMTAHTAVPALLWVSLATFPVVLLGAVLSVRVGRKPYGVPTRAIAEGMR